MIGSRSRTPAGGSYIPRPPRVPAKQNKIAPGQLGQQAEWVAVLSHTRRRLAEEQDDGWWNGNLGFSPPETHGGAALGLPAIVDRASALGRGAHSSRGALLKPGPPCLSPWAACRKRPAVERQGIPAPARSAQRACRMIKLKQLLLLRVDN